MFTDERQSQKLCRLTHDCAVSKIQGPNPLMSMDGWKLWKTGHRSGNAEPGVDPIGHHLVVSTVLQSTRATRSPDALRRVCIFVTLNKIMIIPSASDVHAQVLHITK